jgi:hypothetical protein
MSLRETVLGLKDTRLEPVNADGVPKGLFVGKLTVAQADGLRTLADKPNASAHLFASLVRDADGMAPFAENDIDAITALPADMVGAVVKAGLAFNGMGDDDAEKNSEATASEDSSSA